MTLTFFLIPNARSIRKSSHLPNYSLYPLCLSIHYLKCTGWDEIGWPEMASGIAVRPPQAHYYPSESLELSSFTYKMREFG